MRQDERKTIRKRLCHLAFYEDVLLTWVWSDYHKSGGARERENAKPLEMLNKKLIECKNKYNFYWQCALWNV